MCSNARQPAPRRACSPLWSASIKLACAMRVSRPPLKDARCRSDRQGGRSGITASGAAPKTPPPPQRTLTARPGPHLSCGAWRSRAISGRHLAAAQRLAAEVACIQASAAPATQAASCVLGASRSARLAATMASGVFLPGPPAIGLQRLARCCHWSGQGTLLGLTALGPLQQSALVRGTDS